MESIIQHIDEWFIPKKEYFYAFIENDSRLEGWFKAELIVLFSKLSKEKVIDIFYREPKLYDKTGSRKQIDFSITINGIKHYLELKALCISQSKGTPRNLPFYFRNDNVGIIKDFQKLEELGVNNKWVLGFIYPKPNEKDWIKETNKLDQWKCLTKLENYPSYIFISLFH